MSRPLVVLILVTMLCGGRVVAHDTVIGTGPYGTITPAPTVTSLSPNRGATAGGTRVTITGTNFVDVNAVNFGGIAASSFRVDSASRITAITAAESAATVDVTAVTGSGGSVQILSHIDQATASVWTTCG